MTKEPSPEVADVIDISSRRAVAQPAFPEVPGFFDRVSDPKLLGVVTHFLQRQYGATKEAVDVAYDRLSVIEAYPAAAPDMPVSTMQQRDPEDTSSTVLSLSPALPTILSRDGGLGLTDAAKLSASHTLIYGTMAAQLRARARDVGQREFNGGSPDRGLKLEVWPANFQRAAGHNTIFYRFAATAAMELHGLDQSVLVEPLDQGTPLETADAAAFANPAMPTLAYHTALKYLR